MKSSQINFSEIKEEDVKQIKILSTINGIKTTAEEMTKLCFKVASACSKHLDKESFKQITGLES